MGVLVIGSGPAGVAAVHALLARGLEVTLLDGGDTLDPAIAARVADLVPQPQPWTAAQTEALRGNLHATRRGVAVKTHLGDNFAQRTAPDLVVPQNVRAAASLATGGLSHVWGAAVAPWSAAELSTWPLPSGALDPHFAALDRWIPTTQTDDPPMQHLLSHWTTHGAALQSRGWRLDPARVAVDVSTCVQCALCLHGCPTQSLWNAQAVVERWVAQNAITHAPGWLVRGLEEGPSDVTLHTVHRQTGAPRTWRADRVILAAGTIRSGLLLAALTGRLRTTWATSQYFLAPFVPFHTPASPLSTPRRTLAAAFAQVPDARGGPPAHVQFYGPNDLHLAAIRATLGPAAPWLTRLTNAAAHRLMSLQGYLHSSFSPQLEGVLDHDRLVLSARLRAETPGAIQAVVRELSDARRALGGQVLTPLLQAGVPGDGAHLGASWPMAVQPRADQTDTLGRPAGLSRIHVVDASVLPAIAAPTITWTLMANAHRIASEVPA